MIVIDSHLDLSYNALNWNRDLRLPVEQIRALETETNMKGKARGTNTVAFPELRSGEVAVLFATVLARASPRGRTNIDFRNQEIAYAMAQGQLAYYKVLEEAGVCRFVLDAAGLRSALADWRADSAGAPFGFIFSMEGADPIVKPSQAEKWWEQGLRAVGMSHYGPSAYAHGTGTPGGLTPKGYDLLRAMGELGMILDVTHLADQSFWEALKVWQGPVLASHHNCRALVPGDRQLDDDQIKALIERDAVIGAALDTWMLIPNWRVTMTPKVPLSNVIDHMDHICQLAGNTRHIAIGSDLDGGFGTEQSPDGLDTIVDLQKIPGLLKSRGYTDEDVTGVMHGNWLRFFEKAWH